MNAAYYNEIYLRDTQTLFNEINAYPSDESLWKVAGGISNSGGNLCLHLVGSLNHFIGATLGNTGYVRNRDAEFAIKGLTKDELLRMLGDTQLMLKSVWSNVTEADLEKEYPFEFLGKQTTRWYMNQFLLHLQYHLGQINYHRRLVA
jgi:hypothetical protein